MRTSMLLALASSFVFLGACTVPVEEVAGESDEAGEGASANESEIESDLLSDTDVDPEEIEASPSVMAEQLVIGGAPSAGSFYGVRVHGDSVGNTPRLNYMGTFRFRAERTGKVTKLVMQNRVVLPRQADLHAFWDKCKEAPPGGDWTKLRQCELDAWYNSGGQYHYGDGGRMQLELHEDDGHGFPKAAALSVAKKAYRPTGGSPRYVGTSHGMKMYLPGDDLQSLAEMELKAPVQVTAGKLYHLVAHQLSPQQGSVCMNGNYTYEPLTPAAGPAYGTDQVVMMRESASTPWYVRPNHQPMFAVGYDDGKRVGSGYNTIGSVRAATECGQTIGGKKRVRQTFKITDRDRLVDKLWLRLGRLESGLAPVKVTIFEGGSAIKSATVSESHVEKASSSDPVEYAEVSFASKIKLAKGKSYAVEISSTGDDGYFAYAAVGLKELGLDTQDWAAPEAQALFSSDGGAHWSSWRYGTKSSTCVETKGADLQMLFHVAQ